MTSDNGISKICIVTGTRADYGLLQPLMNRIVEDDALELLLCVTGSHLSETYGHTIDQIEADGFTPNAKVDIELKSDGATDILNSISIGQTKFGKVFSDLSPDLIFVLGDRYELLAVANAATILGIPIGHAHGGETTEGANDELIRHAVSKMSHLHFTSTDVYRKRVIQMGEHPDRVFNVGAFGLENIEKLELLSKEDFENKLDFTLGSQNALMTFHPETMDAENTMANFESLLSALKEFPEMKVIITYPNADHFGEKIIERIQEFEKENGDKVKVVKSLGQLVFLSSLKYMDLIIGNSSSGIIEAPSFKIPTVNIGDRQKGRIAADSVIHSGSSTNDIVSAMQQALSHEFKMKCVGADNPYYKSETSKLVLEALKNTNKNSIKVKSFYDLDFPI